MHHCASVVFWGRMKRLRSVLCKTLRASEKDAAWMS
jgi:hypothetical protein